MSYSAPTRDMQFVINELVGLDDLASLGAFKDQDVGPELLEAILDEAGKFAAEVLAPLNASGDRQGATLVDGQVRAADGFKDAYRQFIDGGWNGLGCPPEHQGQGLPELISVASHEMWNSANLSFALCPLLTAGAIEAIKKHGTEQQQAIYLDKLVSGEWTGTMNLTEPQAGSDLSAVRTKAVPQDDHFLISGQKIYITWGDHDLADNVVHLVLARTPDAPEGVKGISLFIVPKFIPAEDGSPGERNDVRCVSLEHKLGIHASPTCVMAYGDNGGAVGYLVGAENKGLVYMFTMMNEARLKVGLQGLAIAERAYQQARDYARNRVQGRPVGVRHGDRVSIDQHPDVRRMLLTMKAQIEAMRALCYTVAKKMDLARHHPNGERRQASQAQVDLLIPVVKGWCTELGIELASLGVQVHGGMGFIEETGAAQHLRDARILTIYEGTTGIQANDLLGRKLAQDNGKAMFELIDEIRADAAALTDLQVEPYQDRLAALRTRLERAAIAQQRATRWLLDTLAERPELALAGAASYLQLSGTVCGGWLMARAARVAAERLAAGDNSGFYDAKLLTAQFYAEQFLPRAQALLDAVRGGAAVLELADEQL